MEFSILDKFMNDMPLRGVPGSELSISYKGETVYRKAVGYADKDMKRPLSKNDISWIFSCSKVITCLAAMRLIEDGRISLDDPVSKYIPEYADVKIFDQNTGCFRNPSAVMTVKHLFTMQGGLNYDINSEFIKASSAEGKTSTLDILKAIAKIPLEFEPGSHYKYSLCHDVLAGVVEVASSMRFSDYLKKYFFDPLDIKDMGFRPDKEQKSRFCDQFRYSNGTGISEYCGLSNPYILSDEYESGGAGLFSTVDDYMKIITVIANGGKTKDGYSLLRPETIELLTVNRLEGNILNDFATSRLYGYGWGLCGRVHMNPTISCSMSSVGEFGWDGAAGAFSMIDTKRNVAFYFGINVFNFIYGYNFLHQHIRNLVYNALEA